MTEQNLDLGSLLTPSPENTQALVAEVERLRKFIKDYNASITSKLDGIEEDLTALENENARLITVKEGLQVERDACIGLIAQLAHARGYPSGIAKTGTQGNLQDPAPQSLIVIDLPAGQVSWSFEPSEAHLFQNLPAYTEAIEELEIIEKYRRVMSPIEG